MTSDVSIARFLGANKNKNVIFSSICLVLISFFYFFAIGSLAQSKIYTFQFRVTYENIFQTHVASLEIDSFILLSTTLAWISLSVDAGFRKTVMLIFFSAFLVLCLLNVKSASLVGAALTLPFVVSMIILGKFTNKLILRQDIQLSLDYFTITTAFLASLGIMSLVLHIITGQNIVTIEQYPYAIYQQLLSLLTPILMTILVFCIPVKVILIRFICKIKGNTLLLHIVEVKLGNKHVASYLLLCVVLGIGVAFIAHLPVINPNNERIGVDTPRYVDWISQMKNQTANPMYFVLKGDRPLSLMMLFLITEVTKADPFQVSEYSPMFFAPLLVLATFFLTRQLTTNDKISLIASFISAISFQVLVGIYSGFYANWLALILGYLVFGLLLKCLKSSSKINFVALALAITGLLLAHTHTWTIVISVAFVFLSVLYILNYYPKKHFLLLYLILSSSIIVDVLKSFWIGSSIGLEADVSIGFSHGLGIAQFTDRFGTLADTVQTYYGGVYSNIAILGLVMYWLVRCQPRERASIFLLIFMSTALIPLFIGDYVLQSRVLYEIPFQIPAAISLYYIGRRNGKMIFIALLLIASYLSFHVLANLGYVPPTNPLSIMQK